MGDAMGTATPLPRVNGDFLVRPRLLEILDRWSPITLLLAPSGAGKAVLAVQWAASAREAGDDVIWLDGEVDDPAAAVAALARHAGEPVDGDDDATLRRLRRGLRGLDRRVAVVINNAEPIVESIGDALVEIVRDCREVHLVVCLRRRLDPVAKALLEAETRVVGLSDLQFTVPEIQALAQQHGLPLASDEAESIRTSVGGWAALLRTGLEPLPDTGPPPMAAWSPRHVGWFLGVNVAPALPPTALAALARTALVQHPTYGAVLAATGPLDDPARIALESLGILDPLVSEGEPLVRLPPLMRDFFRGRYDERELGPEIEVHHRIVRFWLDAREPRLALEQAVHGRCWALAVEIVEQHWWAVVGADLLEIPVTEVRGHPRAEIGRQVVLPDDPTPSSPALLAWEAELRSVSAEDLVDRAGDPDVLALLTLLMVRDRGRGEQRSALDLAHRVETVIDPAGLEGGAVPPPVARAAFEAGRTRLLAGELVAATRLLRVADGAAGDLALCAAVTGDRAATAHWVERGSGTGGRIAVVLEALQSLDRERSADALTRLRADGVVRDQLWPFAAWAAAEHALIWGGRGRVRAELAAARAATARRRETGWLQGLLVAAEADLCVSLGRTAVAARLLTETDAEDVRVVLARARLARVVGRPEEALGLLDVVAAAGDPSALVELESLVLRAWCLDETGAGAAAAEALDQALERARRDRLVLPFTHVPMSLIDRHARTVPGLGRLAERLREARTRSPYDVVDELPALTPREVAVLEALARGLSLEEVGRELFVSRNTVKSQASSLYRKLRVSGRADAVHKANRMGLLD
jgi:LuxR family maltose regulon positive regulatory protein